MHAICSAVQSHISTSDDPSLATKNKKIRMEFGVALFAALVILLIPPSWQKDPYIDVPFRDNEVPLESQYYRKCRAKT